MVKSCQSPNQVSTASLISLHGWKRLSLWRNSSQKLEDRGTKLRQASGSMKRSQSKVNTPSTPRRSFLSISQIGISRQHSALAPALPSTLTRPSGLVDQLTERRGNGLIRNGSPEKAVKIIKRQHRRPHDDFFERYQIVIAPTIDRECLGDRQIYFDGDDESDHCGSDSVCTVASSTTSSSTYHSESSSQGSYSEGNRCYARGRDDDGKSVETGIKAFPLCTDGEWHNVVGSSSILSKESKEDSTIIHCEQVEKSVRFDSEAHKKIALDQQRQMRRKGPRKRRMRPIRLGPCRPVSIVEEMTKVFGDCTFFFHCAGDLVADLSSNAGKSSLYDDCTSKIDTLPVTSNSYGDSPGSWGVDPRMEGLKEVSDRTHVQFKSRSPDSSDRFRHSL